MAFKVNEDTEVRIPLKTVVMIIAGIVTSSWFVFHIEERIDFLESKIQENHMVMDSNTQFRINWKPPEEVKESIIENHKQNERIAVIEEKLKMVFGRQEVIKSSCAIYQI